MSYICCVPQKSSPPNPALNPAPNPARTHPAGGQPTRGQSVVEQLRQRLQDGTWSIGTKLPGEHELSAELGVGRNTLREALRSLVNAGLLTARRGDGTYVIATDDLEVALTRRVTPEERLHAMEVRSALEIEAARLAATRATPAEVEHLRHLTEQRSIASRGPSDVDFIRADLAWHDAVARAARNPILLEIYLGLDRVTSYFTQSGEAEVHSAANAPQEPDAAQVRLRSSRLDQAHDRLLDALLTRDPQVATEAARHIFEASASPRPLADTLPNALPDPLPHTHPGDPA